MLLWILVIVLIILAIGGGTAVSSLLWLLLVVALIVAIFAFLGGRRVWPAAPPRPEDGSLPHLKLIEVEEATGDLRAEYDAAVARAGKVFNIVKAMSLRPSVLQRSMALYREVMFGPSQLSRQERELLATVVSRANDCFYWTRAHANDLRAEGADDTIATHAEHDYRSAGLDPRLRALCDFAVRLTLRPGGIRAEDVDALRAHGLDDTAIHDAIQVVAYFNYVNRVAEGVGIEPEPDWT